MSKLPNDIYVSGFKLFFRGFNGKYKRYIDKKGESYWKRASRFSFGIYVKPTEIRKNKEGKYIFVMYGNSGGIIGESDTLLGDWEDFLVTDKKTISTWWRTNNTYVYVLGAVTAVGYYVNNKYS